jgi:molybdopterin-binding protein
MKVGARNQLVGKVTGTRRGQVMAQVKFTIPAESQMSSVMTLESLDELGLREGDKVRVLVKAVNVLLVRE